MLKQNHITHFVLTVAAIIALFLYNPWLLYFQNDDMVHIPLSRDGVLLQHNTFRPVCDISLMLDYKLWSEQAWGYHLVNLFLHAVNSILVFIACKKLFEKYRFSNEINLRAFAIAVLFWIYMNHSEAVFWILGRSAMLGMLFFLPAGILYLQRESNFNFILSVLFSSLAWLSYESAWIIPAIFLLISHVDVQNGISHWRKEGKYLLVIMAVFAVYAAFRIYFTGAFTGLYESGGMVNIDMFFLIGNLARLAIRSWLPPSQYQQILIIGFTVLIGLIVFFIIRTENQKLKRVGIIFLLVWIISLLPYVTLGIDTKGVESERFLYMPSFFVCIVIATMIFQLPGLYKTVGILIIYSVNIVLLTHHAKQYRFAGAVVKNTITAVNNLQNKKRLIADGVPQENFGALKNT